jgi:DNA/RNA-binding domain of Phe-tRNA-synthetase-like protein
MSGAAADGTVRDGFVEPALHAEFPGLRLRWIEARARAGSSPPALRRRLRALSDRYRGASVVAMRTKPVPHAFRAFFRQIGLDPDVQRIPGEEVAVGRLLHGEFRSVDRISDACLVALVETGVPVWALDAGVVDAAGPGIRRVTAAEATTGAEVVAAGGSLVVADSGRIHALLFAAPPPAHCPGSRTDRVVLYALGVDGVPDIHLEEALWLAAELVADAE